MASDSPDLVTNLRESRLWRGMSQADVAASLGTTQSAIARLESGTADPRLSSIARYSEVVGLQLNTQTAANDPSLERTAIEVRTSLTNAGPSEALRQVVQFLDDIAILDNQAVRHAIMTEPDTVGDRRWDALLAGIAEYVSRRSNLLVPGWATAPGRFLQRFWFVIEDILGRPAPGLAVAAFTSAPPELSSRGVFLDQSSLVSV
ncbi:helix-turn-helix domain-containing protein [Nocardia alni]|uniref:helix-turn-helix domain-containing protein n=1 Tax=Nocardia alni TaxID=2815723 RepID=UPI001C2354F4|nr:helix-turn-helix transcriptional regulator [Nocardia alni]